MQNVSIIKMLFFYTSLYYRQTLEMSDSNPLSISHIFKQQWPKHWILRHSTSNSCPFWMHAPNVNPLSSSLQPIFLSNRTWIANKNEEIWPHAILCFYWSCDHLSVSHSQLLYGNISLASYLHDHVITFSFLETYTRYWIMFLFSYTRQQNFKTMQMCITQADHVKQLKYFKWDT